MPKTVSVMFQWKHSVLSYVIMRCNRIRYSIEIWRNFFDYKKDNYEKDFSFIKDVGLNFKEIFKEIPPKFPKIPLKLEKRNFCSLNI